MKDAYIKDLPLESTVTFQAAVKEKQTKEKKNGDAYLNFVLVDKTGTMEARLWDDLSVADGIAVDDVVKVQGPTSQYRGKPQLTIKKIRKCEPEEIDDADYLPASLRDRQEMWDELLRRVSEIENKQIGDVVLNILADHEQLVKSAPAAMKLHHAWVGGLMEHFLSLMDLAECLCNRYATLDRSLMLATCVLHDIGKVKELTVSRSFSYSVPGSLLGHVAIGYEMLCSAVDREGCDPEIAMKLKHMVLSHHGVLEHGALKVPMFPEAIAFHHMDAMDASLEIAFKAIREAEEGQEMTPWVNALNAQLYVK